MGLWKIPRIWEGETVFVIGGGPSVSDLDLTPIHNRCVVGVNTAYQLGTWIDILFWGDKKWWRWHHEKLANWPNLIVTNCPEKKINLPEHRVLRVSRRASGWSSKPNTVAWNSNSGYSAINLAALLGAKTIVLIGFDMTSKDKRYHWHKEHPAPEKLKTSDSDFKRFLRQTDNVVKGAEKDGVKLLNASPISKIPEDKIERINLQEFLENDG